MIELLFILILLLALAWCLGSIISGNRTSKKMWRYENPDAYERMVADNRRAANKEWIAVLIVIVICVLLALAGGHH